MPKHTRPEIVFLDDELYFAVRYREKLEERFTVHMTDQPHVAIDWIRKNQAIRGLILDIMMPPPDGVPAARVGGGLDTGLWVLDQLKSESVGRKIPVLILTNRNPDAVTAGLAKLGLPDQLIAIHRKIETPAYLAPSILQHMIDNAATTR